MHSVPSSIRVYAVGDIHGRADLLDDLHGQMLADAAQAGPSNRVAVYVGDYVDRGRESRRVLDILVGAPLKGFEVVHLMGNHEDMLMGFLADPSQGQMWMYNGGDATLRSYGIDPSDFPQGPLGLAEMRDRLVAVLPDHHRAFLAGLTLNHTIGDFLFVHAGVRPGVALDRQAPDDMIWIRDDFLESNADFGKMVVHGHSISGFVDRRANRICIDTGAFASGTLTCLVVAGSEQTILQT